MIQLTLEISVKSADQEAGLHQHGTGINLLGSLQTVGRFLVETVQINFSCDRIGHTEHLHIGHKHLTLIPGSHSPAVIEMILPVGSDAIVVALPYQIMIFMVHFHLSRNHLPVFLRDPGHIELIAEGSGKGHMASGLKRCHTANGVVRAVADMSAHSGQRVNESRSFLNLQPLDSIGVVGAPDLGAVVEHTRIKTGSAAGAVLQKQVREFLYQPLLHLVNAQHIPVIKLLLMLFIEIRAAEVAELAVHIPFYINDIGAS